MRRFSGRVSLYFVTVLVLALLMIASIGAGACLADNWTKTAERGLEGNYSQIQPKVSAQVRFNSVLYAGTEDSQNGCQIWTYNAGAWTKIVTGGFGDKTNATVKTMCVYNSKLYVGTAKNGLAGCEIWSFDGSAWTQVNTDGFGSPRNKGAFSMAVFGSSLYIGTNNSTTGGEVWKYNGSSWSAVEISGFGDANNYSVDSLCVYGSGLFAGTYNHLSGCEVWRYGGSSWTQSVGQAADGTLGTGPGFGGAYENTSVSVMAVFNGKLYAGLTTKWDGEIWAIYMLVPKDWVRNVWCFDGSSWTSAPTTGVGGKAGYGTVNFDTGVTQNPAISIAVTGTSLIIGTRNEANGCEVWSFDGSAWTQLNTRGFGNVNNITASSLVTSGSDIWVGTENQLNGADVWHYNSVWTRISGRGFASNSNYSVASMLPLGGTLFAGTAGNNGGELWSNSGSGWTFDNIIGDANNLRISSMAEYNSKLYLGTKNTVDGGEVWRYDGGSVTQVSGSGFSTDPSSTVPVMDDVPAMAVYGGQLFAGTENLTAWHNIAPGCAVWRYDGSSWTNEQGGGFNDSKNMKVSSMCAYNGSLYVGLSNLSTGCEIWRRDAFGGWSQVNTDGFGNAGNSIPSAMVVCNGNLYIGVSGHNAQVWRYDGTTWTQVGANGLVASGDSETLSLAVLGGVLYAGTSNGGNVARLMGSTWMAATAPGFGEAQNTSVASLAVFGNKIWAGTTNSADGAQIWSSQGPPGSIQSIGTQMGSHGQTLGVAITGTGTHFVNGTSAASFSGEGITVNSTTVSDATHATANITIAPDAKADARDVNVITTNDTPTSLSKAFTVLNPRVTGVTPTSMKQGETRDLTITGAETTFTGGSTASISGTDVAVNSTSVIDATHIKVNVTAADKAQPGARDVIVTTPGVTTDPLASGFTVHSAPPRLDSISKSYGRVGDTVILSGEWFGKLQLASAVKFNGKAAECTSWNDTSITCKVPSGAKSGNVVVTTSEGSSAGKAFAVVNTIPGNNISVDAGNAVKVVFDHVSSPGNTIGTVIHDPVVDGYTVLRGTSREISTDAGYSGDITATMSYEGQTLLRLQEEGLVMLHEEGGKWVEVTRSRDATQKTITGQVTGLSRFTLAIPDGIQLPAASTWYLAEGSTDHGFSTYLTIENPNNRAVTARITYMTSGGVVNKPRFMLPAMSQTTINPADDLGASDFSTKVECLDGEIIAVDRTMSWTGPGAASSEGHSSIGVPGSDKTWYFPEGSSKWGFETWLLIQNPNSVKATCTLTYMIEGVGPRSVTKTVAPNSRGSFFMADDIGTADASIKITSDQPVIPERSMYRNNRREGHNSIGSTEPNQDYFMAEGTTNWGFTTYVLVQNPNNQPTDVTLTFMTPTGAANGPTVTVRANGRKTFRLNDILPGKDCSIRVHGTLPIIAERSMYWTTSTGEASHDSIGVAGAHKTFYLPDGQSNIGWETWTLVQNPNSTPVTVKITYLTPSGQGNVDFTDTIPANSRKTYNMGDKMMNQRAAALIESKTPGKKIMVERSMYWNNRGAGTCTIGGYSD